MGNQLNQHTLSGRSVDKARFRAIGNSYAIKGTGIKDTEGISKTQCVCGLEKPLQPKKNN